MVTETDIMNMGRKIKRSNNPKTLARYQAQIDAWIAELETAQAQAQADILTLEEKIKLEEEARAAENKREQDPNTGRFIPASLPGIPPGDSKKIAVKIAEKAGVSLPLPGIGRSEATAPGREPQKTHIALPGIPKLDESKKVAGPRKCYHYFEFERFHLRRSRF